jgi:Leucine-rich repeat (LRR) protein
MKKLLCLIFAVIACINVQAIASAETIGVIGDDVKAYAGSGSSSDPLHYLFDSDSKVTWKHLCDVKEQGYTEVYEKREGNSSEGKLMYSWTFSGADITAPEGPYYLGVHFYEGDIVEDLSGGSTALYFSFVCKRDIPGKATISMYVGDRYDDNTVLELYYYGGYDSAVVHTSPPVDKNEILATDSLKNIADSVTVKGGYVEFILRHGGNYYLTENSSKDAEITKAVEDTTDIKTTIAPGKVSPSKEVTASPTDKKERLKDEENASQTSTNQEGTISEGPSNGSDDITPEDTTPEDTAPEDIESVYSDETLLGRINEIFPTDCIAIAIADSLAKNVTDEISQADLNGIKRLYLSGKKLQFIDELGKVKFDRLESLEIADNRIENLPSLHMPMLTYLDLSNNSLSDAKELTNMQSLEVILLQNNKLTAMPDIARLPELVSIDASNNLINRLPELKSSTLAYLNLSNNKISKLSELLVLPNLEYIDISGNSIKKLPDFKVCEKLTEIVSKQNTENNANHIIIATILALVGIIGMGVLVHYVWKNKLR